MVGRQLWNMPSANAAVDPGDQPAGNSQKGEQHGTEEYQRHPIRIGKHWEQADLELVRHGDVGSSEAGTINKIGRDFSGGPRV